MEYEEKGVFLKKIKAAILKNERGFSESLQFSIVISLAIFCRQIFMGYLTSDRGARNFLVSVDPVFHNGR